MWQKLAAIGWKLASVIWWLALSVYLGGMVTLGAIAAPGIFWTVRTTGATLPGLREGLNGKDQLGGEIFGVIFQRFQWVELVCLLLMAVICGMWLLMSRSWAVRIRMVLILLLAGVFLYDAEVLTPEVWKTRATWRTTPEEGAGPLKIRFDVLHKRSEALGQTRVWMLVGLVVCSAWSGTDLRSTAKREKGDA